MPEKMLKRYKFGFDLWGLLLFVATMVPTFVWFAVPALDDVLRAESVTPVVDTIGFVLQVLFVVAICFVVRRDYGRRGLVAPLICVALYYVGWVLYYMGRTGAGVILLLTLPPCLAFVFYAVGRRNVPALIPAVGFTVCHLVYAMLNYLI